MLPYPSRRKKSKKIFVLATAVTAIVFASSYYFLADRSDDEVIAKINGQKIFRSEVELRLRDVFEGQDSSGKGPELEKLPKEIVEILVKEVYLEKELTKEALRSDVAKSREVQNKIADAKSKIVRQAYIDSVLKKEITSEKINDKYLELSKELEGKKEYQIFHIVVKTKEEAEKVLKELKGKKGTSRFAELAKKYSIDRDTAEKGGEIDYTLQDSMIKEIATVVAALEKDQISDPVETKFGWHVVKLGDVREAKPLSFEEVKENIRDQLVQERINEINNKIINNAKIQLLIQLKEIEKSENNSTPKAEEVETVAEENPQSAAEVEKTSDTAVVEPAASSNENAAEEIKASESKEESEATQADENKSKSNAKHKKHKKSKR